MVQKQANIENQSGDSRKRKGSSATYVRSKTILFVKALLMLEFGQISLGELDLAQNEEIKTKRNRSKLTVSGKSRPLRGKSNDIKDGITRKNLEKLVEKAELKTPVISKDDYLRFYQLSNSKKKEILIDIINLLKDVNVFIDETESNKPGYWKFTLNFGKDFDSVEAGITLIINFFDFNYKKLDNDNKFKSYLDYQENNNGINKANLIQQAKLILQNTYKSSYTHKGINLPSGYRMIWGRNNLVKEVNEHLKDFNEPLIFSFSGPPGYGKTEAAICTAWEALHRGSFADVLYIRARQTELYNDVIANSNNTSLGWEEFREQLAAQLSNCSINKIQEHLREQAMLIVIDNAETAKIEEIISRLHPMLDPSRVLLTSRVNCNETRLVRTIEIPGLDFSTGTLKLLQYEAKQNDILALLNAEQEQLEEIHKLSCGAPLALHFAVNRIKQDQDINPVLFDLKNAEQSVEIFYKFTLQLAWEKIDEQAKEVIIYLAKYNQSTSPQEIFNALEISDTELRAKVRKLKSWYLIEDKQDGNNVRYDLHPWIREAVRRGLVHGWQQPSLEDLEKVMKIKFGLEN